jgi:hypothetical protein
MLAQLSINSAELSVFINIIEHLRNGMVYQGSDFYGMHSRASSRSCR